MLMRRGEEAAASAACVLQPGPGDGMLAVGRCLASLLHMMSPCSQIHVGLFMRPSSKVRKSNSDQPGSGMGDF